MTMTLSRPTSRAEAADSDLSELEVLFEQHWERLCGFLIRITGDPHEAQDLALETFLRLYQRPPVRRDNLAGWLFRVAANLGFNALRSRRRRTGYENEAGAQQLEAEREAQPDPAAVVDRRQEIERVRWILQMMKPRHARVLVLRHSGLSYAEVAQAAGLRRTSVGAILARAEREFARLYLDAGRRESDASQRR